MEVTGRSEVVFVRKGSYVFLKVRTTSRVQDSVLDGPGGSSIDYCFHVVEGFLQPPPTLYGLSFVFPWNLKPQCENRMIMAKQMHNKRFLEKRQGTREERLGKTPCHFVRGKPCHMETRFSAMR